MPLITARKGSDYIITAEVVTKKMNEHKNERIDEEEQSLKLPLRQPWE